MPPSIKVKIEKGKTAKNEYIFTESFQIGRSVECDLQVIEDTVSRFHAKVSLIEGRWLISDLKSGNGVLVNGVKVENAILNNNTKVELGHDGPELVFCIDAVNPADNITRNEKASTRNVSLTDQYEAHYFSESPAEKIGQHTMMVRRAYLKVRKKQRRKYLGVISVIAVLFFLAGFYAIQKHLEIAKQKSLAREIFYSMKSLELEISGVLAEISKTRDVRLQKNVDNYKAKLNEMEKNYNQFVSSLKIYEEVKDDEELLVIKTARTFGECEINVPEDFRDEVFKYIEKWRSTYRLEDSIRLAEKKGYIPKIIKIMKKYDVPPQFFFLAVQESGLNVNACGPKTRFGIAKGAWQFIPSTAKNYGLKIGPLKHLRKPDAGDERHHFVKSTESAARYIRDIYNTDAQASGLLVIASYNWGQRRVINLIRKMPKNPKERNFWCFLKKYKTRIPKETYDYVLYIFSAAVIGENPRLFGFDFDNPLV